MKRIRKFIACLVMLAMLVAIMPSDLLVEANNLQQDSVRFSIDKVAVGETFAIYFPYDIDASDIHISEGIDYIGFDGKQHHFKAIREVDNVNGALFYNISHHEDIVDEGNGEDMGEIGEGSSGVAKWEDYRLGKLMWRDGNGNLIVSIRFLASDIDHKKPLTIVDKANDIKVKYKDLRVAYYTKTEGQQEIEASHLINDEDINCTIYDNSFTYNISHLDKYEDEAFVYEVYYVVDDMDSLANEYQLLQEGVVIQSGGFIQSENVELPSCPSEPNTPEDIEDENDTEDEDTEDEDVEDEDVDTEDNEFPPIMPEPPALINVEVAKEWVGEALEEVEVALLRDGEIVATQILSEDNNWEYTFESLHKYNNIGEHYYYSIEELTSNDRYAVQYKEVDDYKWKVINTLKKTEVEEDIDDEAVIEDIDDDNAEEDKETIEDEENGEDISKEEDDTDNDTNKEEQNTSNDNTDQKLDTKEKVSHNNDQLVLPKTGEGAAVEYILLGAVLLIIAIILKTKE